MLRTDTVTGGLVPTCLGAAVLPVIMCVVVLVALSCCRFHVFGEIWICLVFVFFVLHSLSVVHDVCITVVGSLIRLRSLLFIDDLAHFY